MPTRKPASAKRKPRTGAKQTRPSWHVPSFAAGVLLAAVGFALVTQVLERSSESAAKQPDATADVGSGESPQLDFSFPDLLKDSEVPANPENYVRAQPLPPDPPGEKTQPNDDGRPIYIQAASFRDREDAESLRAQLILQGLVADTARVSLDSGAWYRVRVGPMDSAAEARNVMSRLREQKLEAIWMKRS